MPTPSRITIEIRNVVNQLISNASVKVKIWRGADAIQSLEELRTPTTIDLQPGFTMIDITVKSSDYISEWGTLKFNSETPAFRWVCTKPDWLLTENDMNVNLQIPIGNIRFAPIVNIPENTIVKPTFNPMGVLVTDNIYRGVNLLNADVHMRVLQKPAIGDPNSPDWDRFKTEKIPVRLADRGNWLVLEYGKFSGPGFLIGVWAPHNYMGDSPPVVLQILPNTSSPRYPADERNFTGIYPYGCVANEGQIPKNKNKGEYELSQCRQAYVELTSNRSLIEYKIVYQLYASRKDLFQGPYGPIVITISPPLLNDGSGVLRDPFTHRDGAGRLIAEVLRFLWSNKLTLSRQYMGTSKIRLQPPYPRIEEARSIMGPVGFPEKCITTVVCHSAAVIPTLLLAAPKSYQKWPEKFSRSLYGGGNEYCNSNWINTWVIDGVGRDSGGVYGQPKIGSDTTKTWDNWRKETGTTMIRRLEFVYAEAGLSLQDLPGVIDKRRISAPRSGKSGWIEEGNDDQVSWLRMSNTYLQSASPEKSNIPQFVDAKDKEAGKKAHNKIYEIGIGYAAARRK
ncbi:hypothetical protein GQF01_02080 [Paenibacillus sp. 5J-6]|uniref:Uncharacterized protein n=1 Tax=Paenibacillus silvestris TaxID=2606219 RepID=A0A6L8USA1_9BACL|nr:hypothetical protein [Paenibacillus silvestris]MZQ80928.1 hypothetical protein [Paenibacillus silvestris]